MSTASRVHDGTDWLAAGRRRYPAFGLLCVCALLAQGCLRAQAKVLPTVPLSMPAPPPRVVQVSDPEPPPLVSLPEEPVRNAPPTVAPPPPRRSDTRPPERPDTAADAQRPVEDPSRPSAPPATLQTTTTQLEGQVERRIRTLLAQAVFDLNRINPQGLNPDARTQFDTARRFVSQAEEALKAKNLVFASNLADKASVLAAQLAGR